MRKRKSSCLPPVALPAVCLEVWSSTSFSNVVSQLVLTDPKQSRNHDLRYQCPLWDIMYVPPCVSLFWALHRQDRETAQDNPKADGHVETVVGTSKL